MRKVFYVVYDPVNNRLVGFKRLLDKRFLEYYAARITFEYSPKIKGYHTMGKMDPDFSLKVLPVLENVFNNRNVKAFKHFKTHTGFLAYFELPDYVIAEFPEEYKDFRYIVVEIYGPELRFADVDKIYLYDNRPEALDYFESEREHYRFEMRLKREKELDKTPEKPSGGQSEKTKTEDSWGFLDKKKEKDKR